MEINGNHEILCDDCKKAHDAHVKLVAATVKAMWIAFMRNE